MLFEGDFSPSYEVHELDEIGTTKTEWKMVQTFFISNMLSSSEFTSELSRLGFQTREWGRRDSPRQSTPGRQLQIQPGDRQWMPQDIKQHLRKARYGGGQGILNGRERILPAAPWCRGYCHLLIHTPSRSIRNRGKPSQDFLKKISLM